MLMLRFKFKFNSQWAFYALTALLMLMLLARYALGVDIPEMLFIGVSLLMVISGNRDQVLAVLVMCVPLCMVFSTIYTCLAGIVTWTVRYKDQIRVNPTFLPVLLMLIWELLHCLFGGFPIKSFIATWIPYLLCLLLMWQDVSEINYSFVVRCLAVSTTVMCLTLLGMVLKRSGFQLSTAFVNMQRLGMAAEDSPSDVLQINPNSLGIICTLAMTGLLQLIITGQGRRTDFALILIMLICGTLTTSRTFLLLLMMMVLLFWMNQGGGFLRKLRFLLMIAVIGVIALFVFGKVFPVAIENFLRRLTVADLSSGRTTLFRIYNRFLSDNPNMLLFGVGLMDFGQKVVTEYAVASNVPHNAVQEILVAWGVPGFALLVWFLAAMIHSSGKKLPKRRLMSFIPLLLVLVKIQLGQMITSSYTMMALIFCYLSMAYNFQQNTTVPPKRGKIKLRKMRNHL